jgi:hypothetical protein
VCLAPFAKKPFNITLTGITNDDKDISVRSPPPATSQPATSQPPASGHRPAAGPPHARGLNGGGGG